MILLRRTRALLFLLVVLALAAVLAVAERVTRYAVLGAAGQLPAADVRLLLREISGAFIIAGIVGLAVAALIAAVAGTLLARPLARLRADTLARARGGGAPLSEPALLELRGVASAVDLLDAEQRRRNELLTRERDELALLVSSVSEGILQLGADGRVVHANPAARTLLGLPAEPRGLPLASVVRNLELRAVLERAAAGGQVGTCEVALDDRRLLVAAQPLAGQGSGAVVAFADLTEIRRLEGVRRDFVANVSHELKTPLTSIRGYVETLLTDELPPELQRQFLEVVHKNADRLHRIVDDLLDLSRLESGGWRPELQQLEPLRVAEEVWAACNESAARKRIAFRLDGEPVNILADPAGIRQILANLLDNAIRYTPEGGRISVRVRRSESAAAPSTPPGAGATGSGPAEAAAGRWVLIEVGDDGVGIPNDALTRIFERFYRVDPARSRAAGGTGLGLAIVKHLTERMGGEVTARSELGKGTTITVRLPAA